LHEDGQDTDVWNISVHGNIALSVYKIDYTL